VLLAETISLGILSLPWAISIMGMAPGVLSILAFGILSTFKNAHPEVKDIAGAGAILFEQLCGRPKLGFHLFGWSANLVLLFVMAAHIISFAIMMDTLSPRKVCGIYWYILGAAIQGLFTLSRTMKQASLLSAFSTVTVVVAVVIVMADVGRNKPRQSRGDPLYQSARAPFTLVILAILCIVGSYTGHVAYLSLASELRNHRHFKRALIAQMSIATVLYTLVGGVIYYYVGDKVKSLSLSSASPKMSKVAYGVASGTIVIAGVVNAHVFGKFLYNKYCGDFMEDKTFRARGWWVVIVLSSWLVAWILAELIPSFPHVMGLVSALLSTWFSFGVPAWMWWHLNWANRGRYMSWMFMAVLTMAIMVFSVALSGVGLYATIKSFVDQFSGGRPFNCIVPK